MGRPRRWETPIRQLPSSPQGTTRTIVLTRNGAKAASWLRLSSWVRRNGK